MARTSFRPILTWLGFALTALLSPHCNADRASMHGGETTDSAFDAAEGILLSAATWTLEWDTQGLDLAPDGGWSVTTNLGYRVDIDRAFHVSHNVALVPCPPPDTKTEQAKAPLFGLSISTAHAHEEEADPSLLEAIFISDLSRPEKSEIGASSFLPARYCQAYWLVARGMVGASSKDGLDLSNRSVYFTGTWEKSSSAGVIDVDTWWPQGKLVNLRDAADPAALEHASSDAQVRFAWIEITSPLARAFDDIEFATTSEAILEDRVLDNLTAGADMRVFLAAP